MTFTAGAPLTAAQLNTHLRDNLLETATSKATVAGQIFAGQGKYSIAARLPTFVVDTSSGSTNSTTYTDLASEGPSVTVTTGQRAMVWLTCESEASSNAGMRVASYTVSGATEREPLETNHIRQDGNVLNNGMQWSQFNFEDSLNPGENTFTMVYKVGTASYTGTFRNRSILVWPL